MSPARMSTGRLPPAQRQAPRVPKKKVTTDRVWKWTVGSEHAETVGMRPWEAFDFVCKAMRAPGSVAPWLTRRMILAIDTHFKHSALVVPSVPRGINPPDPLVLWRGVRGDDGEMRKALAPGATISSGAGCYTSFSHDRGAALHFAGVGHYDDMTTSILFRLQVDRIARGTPWIWFNNNAAWQSMPARWQNSIFSYDGNNEREVLLPPGYFKVLNVSKASNVSDLVVVDVAYAPRPQYVRRGVAPRLAGDGKAVLKTVGGHALVMDHPAMTRNVQTRQTLVAGAAARLVRGRPRARSRDIHKRQRTK